MIPSARNGDYRRRTFREAISGNLYLDLGGDTRDTVLLAGSGRSGTTFVSDVISSGGDFRYIFEPFHPERVGACSHFDRKQYLSPDDTSEEYVEAARRTFSGGVRSGWTDRFNRRFFARKRLVKDIRTNLMLGWMHARFPEMKIVFLLRHPCAVTESRLRLGWRDDLSGLMSRQELVRDHLRPFEAEIRAAKDAFERSVYLWCIENHVPLVQLDGAIERGQVLVVRYEDLLAETETELQRLFSYLSLDVPDGLMAEMTRLRRDELVNGWKAKVSPEHQEWTGDVLRRFGLNGLYGEDGATVSRVGAEVTVRGGR